MGLRQGWMGLGEWVVPRSERAVMSLAVIAFYLLGMITLIVMPLQLLSIIAKRAGAVLHLSPQGNWFLLMIVLGTFAWSIVVGGFAKAFFTRNHLDLPWLIAFGLGLLFGLAAMFDRMREAMGAFGAVHAGDNPTVTGFITFWVLMVGYAGKAVWDEARDRMSDLMKSFIPRTAAATKELIDE